jgi:hypothetical protein
MQSLYGGLVERRLFYQLITTTKEIVKVVVIEGESPR